MTTTETTGDYWIEVRQDHIDRGVPRDPQTCPVYFACEDVGLPIYQAGIAQLRFRRAEPGEQDWYQQKPVMMVKTSEDLFRRMRAFDLGEGMAPFGFWLTLAHQSGSPDTAYMGNRG